MADTTQIHSFHGGLHLDYRKALSARVPSRDVELPPVIVLPLQQHIGMTAEALVRPGDLVAKGDQVARATDYVSAGLHAPTSGEVVAVEPRPVAHPSGLTANCIVIKPDGEDRWGTLPEPIVDYLSCDQADLRERIRWAGIVGLGGAGFPTAVKVNVSGRRR